MRKGGFAVSLIDGVTGSGKTEVYFEAVAETLRQGKQVLILLPEIALTAAFLDRFQDRFGSRPAEWHSDISPRMRERVWRQAVTGEVRVVAGARSALFLPFDNLGLIIVDEEHDPAYKQEDRVFYNARDMAVVRARIGDFPIVLVSATPSVESQVNGNSGRYNTIHLHTRFGDAAMPDLHLVDMRRHPPERGGFLSPVLLRGIAKTIEKGEQALLFLNRRGYAPLTLCRVCGHRFQCPQCSSWLVEHRFRSQLQCHQCGYSEPTPDHCPECGTFDHLAACGPGVERIAEEVEKHFPEARTIVLSSDLMGVKRLRLELEAIVKGEADIVIGTQLVAKGHNFPLMTLVGIVDADLGLANGDPRAAERTFQLLSQVTGRAGRTGRKSHGLLQTYQPQHPVMQAIVSGDAEAFYDREIIEREKAMLPPFGRLASIIVSADSRAEAETHARALRASAPQAPGIMLLGPAEAPLALIRGRHRFRLLVHGKRNSDMQSFLRAMITNGPKERGSIHVQTDIDPAKLPVTGSDATIFRHRSCHGIRRPRDSQFGGAIMEFYFPTELGEQLAFFAAVVSSLIGLVVMFAPMITFRLFGLQVASERRDGLVLIRSCLAGFYLGLGASALLLAQPMVYLAFGGAFALASFGALLSILSRWRRNDPQFFTSGCACRARCSSADVCLRTGLMYGLKHFFPVSASQARHWEN